MCVLSEGGMEKKKDPMKEALDLLERYEEGCPPRSSKYQDGGE